MAPNLMPLYLAAAAVMSLLGYFARSNKRTGWAKPTRSSVPNLVGMQVDWGHAEQELGDAPEEVIARKALAPSPQSISEFSAQLTRLHGALGKTVKMQQLDSETVKL